MFVNLLVVLLVHARGRAIVLVVLYEACALIASEARGPRRAVCQYFIVHGC
jgi:hypothetical protein